MEVTVSAINIHAKVSLRLANQSGTQIALVQLGARPVAKLHSAVLEAGSTGSPEVANELAAGFGLNDVFAVALVCVHCEITLMPADSFVNNFHNFFYRGNSA
jgi:hypothetical protein